MNKILEYVIGTKDATAKAIRSALSGIRDFAAKAVTNLANFRAGAAMLAHAAEKALNALALAFRFETMAVHFKTLIGSMDEARAHVNALQDLGDSPPFSIEQFAAASRAMMVMTGCALGFRKSLELVGDAAAATGQPIESLAHEVGRAFAIIRDGQPLSRATMALRNMGVLSPEVAQRLQDLQAAGASNETVWGELEAALKRYGGAMAETAQTGEGMVKAIEAQWGDILRGLGTAILDVCKDGLALILAELKRLRENGTISRWAANAGRALDWIAGKAGAVKKACAAIWKAVKATIGVAFAFGAGADDELANGGGFLAQVKAGARVAAQMWKDTVRPSRDTGDDDADRIEREKARDERRKAKAAKAARKDADADARKRRGLADGQARIDGRKAADAAQAAKDAAQAEREAEERTRREIERNVLSERARLMEKQLQEYIRAERDAENEMMEAEKSLNEARSAEQTAWSWYRDRDSWKAQLQEERDNAAAEKQFEKDFTKLKSRRSDWRTAKLNDDDELIRRVYLTREKRTQAEEYAKATAANWTRLAEMTQAVRDSVS